MNRNVKDTIVEGITGVSVLLIIFIIVSILAVTIVGGWPNMNWTFLSEFPKDGMTKGGIFPAIVGTAVMTIIMAAAAVPFGVITANIPCGICQRKIHNCQNNTVCCENTCCCTINNFRAIRAGLFHRFYR
jgi:ABC-type phosphate transport system permease subunit